MGYIRRYGSSATRQVSSQTNDDDIEREMQTENIEMVEKWCQHPPEDLKGRGCATDINENSDELLFKSTIDSKRLDSFIRNVGPVINILLEECDLYKPKQPTKTNLSNI